MSLDVKNIKKRFPIFKENPNLVYLDTTASALKPQTVIDSIVNYYTNYGVNIHRGVYNLSYEATLLYENSRETVAKFINADYEEVIFTKGTTNSLNMVAQSFLHKLGKDDEIITSNLEHHSSFLPWLNVSKKTGAKLIFVNLDKNGDIDLNHLKEITNRNTKIVALTHVSNVMGRIQPVKEIVKIAKSVDAITVIDSAQAVAHFPIDVKDLNVDFLAFSAHKMMGPSGVGVLYINKKLHDELEPFEYGGEMANYVNKDSAEFRTSPIKYEAGTPIIAGVIALKESINLLVEIGFKNIKNHINDLNKYALKELKQIKGVTVYNNSDTGIITFNIDGVHPHDVATIFDDKNICLRAGEHCAQLTMKWLGEVATLRASFYIYNSKEDVDKFIKTVKETVSFFQKVQLIIWVLKIYIDKL